MKNEIIIAAVFAALVSVQADPLSFTENFDSGISGFTLNDRTAAGSNAGKMSLGVGGGVTGNSGRIGGGLDFGSNGQAGAWMQVNGVAADALADFSVSYDFKIMDEGNWSDSILVLGDLDGGNYYTLYYSANTPDNDLWIASDSKRELTTQTVDNYTSHSFARDSWYTATLAWSSTLETLSLNVTAQGSSTSVGAFDAVLDGSGAFNSSLKSYTDGIQFGFGSHNDGADFDNITITGTVIPEPATLGLISAFGGAILFLRRRIML